MIGRATPKSLIAAALEDVAIPARKERAVSMAEWVLAAGALGSQPNTPRYRRAGATKARASLVKLATLARDLQKHLDAMPADARFPFEGAFAFDDLACPRPDGSTGSVSLPSVKMLDLLHCILEEAVRAAPIACEHLDLHPTKKSRRGNSEAYFVALQVARAYVQLAGKFPTRTWKKSQKAETGEFIELVRKIFEILGLARVSQRG